MASLQAHRDGQGHEEGRGESDSQALQRMNTLLVECCSISVATALLPKLQKYCCTICRLLFSMTSLWAWAYSVCSAAGAET
mmetsp:Transcript_35369/g.43696  ORF Transcript_35369/g.43696 Transcript_35369/m.43696 type:complete len:81 (+) Transcript_35369:469-711(+)